MKKPDLEMKNVDGCNANKIIHSNISFNCFSQKDITQNARYFGGSTKLNGLIDNKCSICHTTTRLKIHCNRKSVCLITGS